MEDYPTPSKRIRGELAKLFPRLERLISPFMDGLLERTMICLANREHDPEPIYNLVSNLKGLEDHRLRLITHEQALALLEAVLAYKQGYVFKIATFPPEPEDNP